MIGEDVTLAVQTCCEPCVAVIDEGQLEQVLMNLVVNARDAMPNGGRLMIETGEEVVTFNAPMLAGGRKHVRLSVVDTGSGIPDNVR
jgi:two-component system cell cycle sensor histidine kinase/response regulator CckA